MKENELNLKKILSVFKKYRVKYIVIGGQAAIALGSSYTSFDVDFCYSRNNENLDNIIKALKPFNPYLRGADKDLPFIFDTKSLKMGLNFTFSTDIGDIDLLGEVSGLGTYNSVLEYSENVNIFNISCRVLTLEGLIKSKKASGRPKDLILLKELEAIKEIREQNKNKI